MLAGYTWWCFFTNFFFYDITTFWFVNKGNSLTVLSSFTVSMLSYRSFSKCATTTRLLVGLKRIHLRVRLSIINVQLHVIVNCSFETLACNKHLIESLFEEYSCSNCYNGLDCISMLVKSIFMLLFGVVSAIKSFTTPYMILFPKHKVNGHLGWMATMFKKKKKVYYVVQAHLSKMI